MAEKYTEGEDVLAFFGPNLYSAKVVEISKSTGDSEPYLIHYSGWHKRYDQWVGIDTLNKRTADNLEYQIELAKASEQKESTTPKKAPHTEGVGIYKRINGIKYDRDMLEAAEKATAGAHDNVISIEEAKTLLKVVLDDDKYSVVERRTMRYIRENYKFTPKADAYTRKTISTWANQKSAAEKEKAESKPKTPKKKVDEKAVKKAQEVAGRKKVPSLVVQELEDICSYHDTNTNAVQASESQFKTALRKAFRIFDANHNNMLEKDELAEMLRSMGRRPLQQKIDSIFDILDVDGDGSICFSEFLKYFQEHHAPLKRSSSNVQAKDVETEVKKAAKRKHEEEEPDPATKAAEALKSGKVSPTDFAQTPRLFQKQMRAAFNAFDKNGNNSISKKEVTATLKQMGQTPKAGKVDAIFMCCDTDGNGTIDFDEFCKYFKPSDVSATASTPNKRAKTK